MPAFHNPLAAFLAGLVVVSLWGATLVPVAAAGPIPARVAVAPDGAA